MTTKKYNKALLFGTTSALLLTCGAGAYAEGTATMETVIVTGSRIPMSAKDFSSPVLSVTNEDMSKVGTTNLADFLTSVPALLGSVTQTQTSGYGIPANTAGYSEVGLNMMNLRNLGEDRTLTLVNGHRQVGSSIGSSAVDVNTIPTSLLERVDVVTGGRSAVYGADAVSGVVNFVMKQDLEGIRANVQTGVSQFGGGNTLKASVAYGTNFDGDKGNVSIAVDYSTQARLRSSSRSFSSPGGYKTFVKNPDKNAKYTQMLTNDAQYIYSGVHGSIWSDPYNLNYPDFQGTGAAYNLGTPVGNAMSVGGDGMPVALDLTGDLLPKTQNTIVYAAGHYDFNRYLKISADFKYAHSYSDSFGTAPFDDYVVIQADNAFLPKNVADAISAGDAGYGLLSEDYLSLRRRSRVDRDNYAAHLGAQGELPEISGVANNLTYDLAFTWGKATSDTVDVGNRIEDRFFAALDSVRDSSGKAVCRSSLNASAVPAMLDDLGIHGFSDTTPLDPSNFGATFTPGANSGCVAFNPFDPDASNQKAAIGWITGDTHSRGTMVQRDFTGSVAGQIPVADRVFAGPLGFAVGGEYRDERVSAHDDELGQNGQTFDRAASPMRGSYSVGEIFGEGELPLIKNMPLIENLSVSGAVRYSRYSTKIKSTTWNYGGTWSMTDWLTLKATNAFAVRAPNLGEMFAPTHTGFASVGDPCDASRVHNGTGYRLANCRALMSDLGVAYDPTTASLDTGNTIEVASGGNSKLKPETARTFTAGFEFTPTQWVPNLHASMSWYRIQIANAISEMSASSIANECVDLPTINNQYCGMITRASSGTHPGSISHATSTSVNVATYETSGVDYSLYYLLDSNEMFGKDIGNFTFHMDGNFLNSQRYVSLPGADVRIDTATTYSPKHAIHGGIDWTLGGFTASYTVDWYSTTYRLSRTTRMNNPKYMDPKYWEYPAQFMNDIQLSYTTKNNYEVYFGVNNMFNQKPGIGSQDYPVGPLGRNFYMGLRMATDGGLPELPRF